MSQFTWTCSHCVKGEQKVYDGYVYSHNKTNASNGNRYWLCKDSKKYSPTCKGRLTTNSGQVIKTAPHCDEPSETDAQSDIHWWHLQDRPTAVWASVGCSNQHSGIRHRRIPHLLSNGGQDQEVQITSILHAASFSTNHSFMCRHAIVVSTASFFTSGDKTEFHCWWFESKGKN